MANWPTGPQPQIATVSPVSDLRVLGGHVAGREDVGQEQRLFVGDAVRHLDRADIGHRDAQIFGLAAAIAAEHVAEAEQAGGRMAHRLDRHLGIRIGAVAAREQALLAEPALRRS